MSGLFANIENRQLCKQMNRFKSCTNLNKEFAKSEKFAVKNIFYDAYKTKVKNRYPDIRMLHRSVYILFVFFYVTFIAA